MPKIGLLFLFFFGLIHSIAGQQDKIVEINYLATRVDQMTRSLEFKASVFEDDFGNETNLKAFFKDGLLLKLEATSRNLRSTTKKSFYFSQEQLVLVDMIKVDHPGLPNWEEAKSDELGAEELRRVQNIATEEKRFYLSNWDIIKALPEGGAQMVDGQALKLEVDALLRKLE